MSELQTLWLPLTLCGLAIAVLLVDVLRPVHRAAPSGRDLGLLVATGLAGLLVASLIVDGHAEGRREAAYGAYVGDAFTIYLQRLFLVAGLLAALAGLADVAKRTPRRQGEYWLMLLSSLLGMVLLPAARDLVLLVLCFELMGLPLYILAAYAKTDPNAEDPQVRSLAAEASIKLYLVGATSTAVTLFGLALLTGMAGTTRLDALGSAPLQPLSALGLLFVLGGIGYKIGMAPFHMWVPDTYQGARLPFVAFLSVAPKAAGLVMMAAIFVGSFGAQAAVWLPPLLFLAFLSMAIGNLMALPQTDLRRLLGYSGIAQMGYALVAMAANGSFGLGMVLFFVATYTFTNFGAFVVLHLASEAGGGFGFDGLAGLWRRAPGLAIALACFLLSLAGIPFMVGFWAKLYVLLAAWRAQHFALVVAAIVLAVLGLFYYLRVLRAAYMTDDPSLKAPKVDVPISIALGLCVGAVVVLGLWPQPLVEAALRAAEALLAR